MSGEHQKSSSHQPMGQSPSAEVEPNRSDNETKDEKYQADGSDLSGEDSNKVIKEGEGVEEEKEEEEMECGFCLFMKGGGCKDEFIAWEKCVEDAEKNKEDIVETCFKITDLMKKCMDAHADYYAPILNAEKAMEEEAGRALEEAKADVTSTTSQDTDKKRESGASVY